MNYKKLWIIDVISVVKNIFLCSFKMHVNVFLKWSYSGDRERNRWEKKRLLHNQGNSVTRVKQVYAILV